MPAGLFSKALGHFGFGFSKGKALYRGSMLGGAAALYGAGSLSEEIDRRRTGSEDVGMSGFKAASLGLLGTMGGIAVGRGTGGKIIKGGALGFGALSFSVADTPAHAALGFGAGILGVGGFAAAKRGGFKLGTAAMFAGGAGVYSALTDNNPADIVASAGMAGGATLAGFAGLSLARRTGNLIGEGAVRGATFNKTSFKDLTLRYSPSGSARKYRSLGKQIRGRASSKPAVISHPFDNIGSSQPLSTEALISARKKVRKRIGKTNPVLIPTLAATAAGAAIQMNKESFGLNPDLPPEYAAQMEMSQRALPPNMNTEGLSLGVHHNRKRRRL